MRIRHLAIFALAALAALAQAQTPSNKTDKTNDEKSQLWFAQTAAVIAINTQHLDLNGYAVAYIDQTIWTPLLKDKDAGPFLKLKEPKPGRKLVILISNPDKAVVGVFFDDATPAGMAVLKPGEKLAADSLKEIPKDALKETGQKLRFENAELASDDGDPIPAFSISVEKTPN
ncbi:MAG: hypothetical protein ACHP79_09940 [Terriglobales bacterium]